MRSFILSILFSFLSSLAIADDLPNIVLILADDLGWTGLGCFGSDFYETPNIDGLASEGVRFTTAFSAGTNCAPSRASLMSGQYTPKHRVLYVGPGDYQNRWRERKGDLSAFKMIQPRGETTLSSEIDTMAECLKSEGYRTAMFGKWHLGNKDLHPSRRGFDVAIESHGD
jgi:arylsulfatase A-like enzyme